MERRTCVPVRHCDERQEPQDRGRRPEQLRRRLQRRRLHQRGRVDQNVTLNNIGQTTGCQSGRAIYVENTDASASRESVTIEGNTVWHYNKNGIDVRGNVDATILGNTVTGNGPVDYIAQNGIVVYGAPRSRRSGATRSAGTTTRPPTRRPPASSSSTPTSASTGRTSCPATRPTSTTAAPSAASSSAPNNEGRRGRNTNP